MKTILLSLVLIIGGTNLYAQIGPSVSPEVQPFRMPEHPATATQVTLPTGGSFTIGQGEQPLWQFAQPEPEPLGDVARRYRDEWKTPKSKIRLEK